VSQTGYTAEFAHRKLQRMKCTLVFNTTAGSRVICDPLTGYTAANYTFQP